MNPKELVRKGYNLAAYAHRDDRGRSPFKNGFSYRAWSDELGRRLERGAKILDLGCGNGLPMAKSLAKRFDVLGIDLSDIQVRRAKKLVPGASFRRGDMCKLRIARSSLDSVVCLYALIHVPRREQRTVIRNVSRWLKPGGLFLLIVGMNAGEGGDSDWLGVKGADMFWAQEDLATYERWFSEEGFRISRKRRIPEGDVAHQLYLLAKRGPLSNGNAS